MNDTVNGTSGDRRMLPVGAVEIRPGDAWDTHLVAALIADALHGSAVAQWLVPDSAERRSVLYVHALIDAGHGLRHGHVDIATVRTSTSYGASRRASGDERRGVAGWRVVDSDTPAPHFQADAEQRRLACGQYLDRFRTLHEAVARHRPAGPHVHLAFHAVAPAWAGRGIGTRLLAAHHQHLDTDGVDAYLLAPSERARRLYLRHRYRDHGPPVVLLPDGPVVWPMWREARPRDEARSCGGVS